MGQPEYNNRDIEAMKSIISKQLRAARELRNLSVRKAAGKLGVSASYLSQMESGQRRISLELLFRAGSVYRVSLSALLGREEIPGHKLGKKILDFVAGYLESPATNFS